MTEDLDRFTAGTHPFALVRRAPPELLGARRSHEDVEKLLMGVTSSDLRYAYQDPNYAIVRGFSEERLKELGIGYDLDLGGHEWSNPAPDHPLVNDCCALWESPDLDYLGLQDVAGWDVDLCAFAPNSGHFQATRWPPTMRVDGDPYDLVGQGIYSETDHDCICHGGLEYWTGAAGEPKEPITLDQLGEWSEKGALPPNMLADALRWKGLAYWKCSGNVGDIPYPLCDRCEGDGHVTSPGGEWALYRRT